ncbi:MULTISPECIES: ATP-binding protein [Butyricimonas]|uniref:ATP-binding protein n=1 Tax=Butyricimonas TaxID=574697 RepID=UPI00208C34CD|nr:ATP-binding protein [Butyricimonas paravirosa]BDF56618.1 hybrid sensor histidine kinase/response regulator [Odoribacteraceae bacterium]GKH95482.1 hybrid sensor histidine kinase/response regulator [Odoribacteraceae bacterium]GKH98106.1 hybrid sensor histidine kinase/response regulator [Odoribacteraceae bacterium]GKI01100.1 hybrid sensor histidine kinase/response regulator [Odoribacteraceae bacterium]
MQRPFKFTKLKLITGYILILLLGAIAIVFIYKQTIALTQKGNDEIVMQQKLFIISNTLTKLYEAENTGIAFSQTGTQKNFDTYMKLIEDIKDNMDTLKNLSISSEQNLRIDTINTLLGKRIENLKDLYYVKKYYIPEDFYNKTIEKIGTLKDSADIIPDLREKIITVIDSSYIIRERKGLFRTKRDSILKVDTTLHRIVDTLSMVSTNNNTDTLMNVIRDSWSQYQQQKEEIDAEVSRREAIVIQSGQHITERLKRVLKDLEKEELENTMIRLEQQQITTHHLTRTISWIAIIACVLVVFFVVLIINDITQSQRYRRELEAAKTYTERLLHNREKLMLTVTHDIKSPLSSIIGYIELLNNTQLEERQHYFLKNMKGTAEHILHLANNMLDFSKLESNKMEINTVPYNPGRLLQETTDSFLPLAAQKSLELKSDISNALNGLYLGDSMKVRQIVVNILSNAIKYTREGKVSLSAFISPTKDDQFIIVIKDSGPGMTEEEQELIFKEFTRLTPQHNNGAEGTGLGLTITLQLVHLLDGELTLESKKGEGSTFTVKFPLIKATAQESQPTETPSSPPVRHEGMKAFIVDDDILQLTVTTELLRKAGIQCDTCTHPQEVLSRLEKGNYNIVLSDIQMPEMDGFELVQQIRESQNQQIKSIPVIALSARDDMHEKEYQEAGFSAYLNKPYTPEQLYSRVNDLLGCTIETKQPTTQTSDKNAPYNLDMIMVFADNDKDAANQIIGSFISDCKTNFQLLAQHLELHETEQIAKLAHKMLPMFKQLAINDVIPSLLFLEKMPLDTEENKIRESIEKILQEGNNVLQLLEKETRQ